MTASTPTQQEHEQPALFGDETETVGASRLTSERSRPTSVPGATPGTSGTTPHGSQESRNTSPTAGRSPVNLRTRKPCNQCGRSAVRKWLIGDDKQTRAQAFCNEREAAAYAVKFQGREVAIIEVDDDGSAIQRIPQGPAPWAK